ncbi:hypothetical protein EHYA_09976 [Embleya hyalina]|uniref:Uncharacterized protein n=1 Tax=Embleya hyalina TaxID=516124 RepID=A0A401Z5U4_9ACTN|nr:hypothetical protein EHYA_09976 [Embleya hyalina]
MLPHSPVGHGYTAVVYTVRRVRVGIDPAPPSGEELNGKGESMCPFAPIATWGAWLWFAEPQDQRGEGDARRSGR